MRLAALRHEGTGYNETGGLAALSGSVDANVSAIATWGLYGSTDFILGDGFLVEVKAMIGWEHHVGETPTATHAFAGGNPFTVAAAGFGSGPVGELGIGIAIAEQTSLDLSIRAGQGSGGGHAAATATLSGSF